MPPCQPGNNHCQVNKLRLPCQMNRPMW